MEKPLPINMYYESSDAEVITREKLIWAINTFEPYKSPGPDGIIPKMLQVIDEDTISWLLSILNACIRQNYFPTVWREAKVIYIPKPGRRGHILTKDYRPISLTSFNLKTIERILDIHIRQKIEGKAYKKKLTEHAQWHLSLNVSVKTQLVTSRLLHLLKQFLLSYAVADQET